MKHIIAAVVLAAMAGILASCDDRTYDRMYGGVLGKAREAVRDDLRDPYSAKFTQMEICTGNTEVVTGAVNAKNAFGAYTGDETFFARGGLVAFYKNVMFDNLARECYGSNPIWEEYLKAIPSDIDRLQGGMDIKP